MAGNQINSESKMEALEIEDDLADAIKQAGRDGLRFKDGAHIFDLNYDRFYLLAQILVSLKRFKIERSQAGNENRLFLLHHAPPIKSAITVKQKEVLDLLVSEMDDEGLACVSFKKMMQRTSCAAPQFAIDRLDCKGFIEVIDRGTHECNIYRVFPNRDGPRGYSPMRWQR